MGDRLKEKVCLITGTGGAIGRASALAFAGEGARVVGCDKASRDAQETLDEVLASGGDMISLHPVDLAEAGECERLVEQLLSHYDRLDVLFNNAAHFHHGWITDSSEDFWFRTIDEELHIVFRLCRAAWGPLRSSRGTIVNMGSTAGHTTFRHLPGIAHSAAKGGVIAMTRHLALEGRHDGIRANSISPGVIGTPAVLAQARDTVWDESMRGRIMRGSYGTPEEIAAVALFLASDESAFINAADIVADGGMLSWG